MSEDRALAARREAAEALRRLIGVVAHAPLSADELELLAGTLTGLAEGTRDRWGMSRHAVGARHAAFDSHPFTGRSHAFAPPMVLEEHDGMIVGEVTFTTNYEGYPGVVHGGLVAAVFDTIVARAATLSGKRFMTGTLSVRYRRPTPVGVRLAVEAHLGEHHGRRVMASGRLLADGHVTAEAEALFITIPDDRYATVPGED